jgi:hypothetical protein
MKSILDSSFRYTPSFDTDVRKTFERVRREQLVGRGSATLHATGCEEMKRPEVANAALEWELM